MGSRRLDLRAGARLDRYELMFPLAEGGMAAVWLARLRGKRGFEQLVAIKVIKPHLSEDMRFEEMFLDEARIASRIRHPNVAGILDLGEEQGILYLVMEWVDGDSLSRTRRLVAKHGAKLPLRISLRIMADVAAGLHAAHEQKDESGANLGVIHRDVSPQNILVSTSGAVKVIDFGIAKARNRAAAETTDGLVKGKVAYMSPEQAEGLPIDRRADVWAVGVCLYELVTGRLPFDGDSQQEILRLLVRGTDVPPLPNDVPSVVRGVIGQALARDPADRFLTAAALERALEGALTTLDLPTTSDDIATFLNATCPERLQARREMLAEVEKVTESLDGAAASAGDDGDRREPETKDVTPPSSTVTAPLPTSTQPVLRTEHAAAKSSLDVGKEPIVETQVTHSAERAPMTTSPKSRAVVLAIVALSGLSGAVAWGWRASQRSAKTTTAMAATTGTPATPTLAPSATPAAPATSTLVEPAAAISMPAPSATQKAVLPTAPATRITTAAKPSPPRQTTAATPSATAYDSDGIPIIVPKK